MNTKSASESTSVKPGALIGFLAYAIGVLMALFAFVVFPTSARADNGPCDDVYFELYYGTGNDISLEVAVDNPTGATIFYTCTFNTPNNYIPTHTGTTPGAHTNYFASGSKIHIPYGSTIYINAIAWKSGWSDSENVSSGEQHNPNW
jgi:hypothetical protein